MQQLSKLRKIGPPARQVKLRSIQARASIDPGFIEKKANAFAMEYTPVGTKLMEAYEDKVTGVVLEGGSRSSKTHSIIQFLIKYAQDHEFSIEDRRVLIARQKATWTAATVLYDFINVMKFYKLFDHCHYNKTSKILRFYQTDFYFGGLDDAQKLHGFQSDIFWINEAVEAGKDDFDQLEQRLKGFFILDYNPSAEEHWIYDSVIPRKDVRYIHSTMLDNPFIAERSRLKILSYDPGNPENVISGTADKNKWEIYGLGLRSKIEGVIFTNWQTIAEMPEYVKTLRHRFGVDWGFSNDPSAIVNVYFSGNDVWVDELCYDLEMKYPDIADIIKDNGLKNVKGYADSSDPRGIREVHDRGCNIHPADKPQGSVNAGINILKECRIFVTERSVNLIKEFKNYKWMQNKNGKYLNEPLDDFNHCFTGDTMITTQDGQKQIKDIVKGEKVLTSQGFKEVLLTWNNGKKQVNKYSLQFDTFCLNLECTPTHKIKTNKGWIPISMLKSGMTVYLTKHIRDELTNCTLAKDTFQNQTKECTLSCGKLKTTRRPLKAGMFTTSMKTRGITYRQTSRSKKVACIYQNTEKTGLKTIRILQVHSMQKGLRPLKNGTQAPRVLNGIQNTHKITTLASGIYQKRNVNNAQNHLSLQPTTLNFVQTTANLCGGEKQESTMFKKNADIVALNLQSINIIKQPAVQESAAVVYDLTVKDAHEYFANGLLVSNCLDALRYVIFMEKRPAKKGGSEKVRQTLGGII